MPSRRRQSPGSTVGNGNDDLGHLGCSFFVIGPLGSEQHTRSRAAIARTEALGAFNAESIAATGGCGYVHPGDIPHRLFNRNKDFEPTDVMAAHHMAAAGMEYAIVANFAANAASGALYRSAGFEPWHVLDSYTKAI